MISKNKRNDIEIIAEMLSLAQEEVKKTYLMYQTNLSYSQLIYYMDFLLDKGFLEERNGGNNYRYIITDKGRMFLDSIEKVMVLAR